MQLPPIRKLILPDPGHIIVDVDMAGADAQVVAWEANDEDLKQAFRDGLKIHVKNFEDFYKTPFIEEKHKYKVQPGHIYAPYDEMKRAVHATNYYASARTVAATLQWKVSEAENFQRRWLKQLHPGIGQWHRRIEKAVQSTRTVRNKFGNRIVYFGRPAEVLPQALAWIPQSTVAIVAAHAAVRLWRNVPWVTILMQVHDSLVFQIPNHRWTANDLATIHRHINVTVPYDDPLEIGWAIAASRKTWGDCAKVKWTGDGLK